MLWASPRDRHLDGDPGAAPRCVPLRVGRSYFPQKFRELVVHSPKPLATMFVITAQT
jgi:hypothetical protein